MCKASNPTIKLKLTGGSQCYWIRAYCPQGLRDIVGSRATETNTVMRFQTENSAKLSRSWETCFLFHFDLLFAVFSMGIFKSANIPMRWREIRHLLNSLWNEFLPLLKLIRLNWGWEAIGGNWKGISNARLNTALKKGVTRSS